MWTEEERNKKGRWGNKKISEEQAEAKLSADDGLLKEQFHVLGCEALARVIEGQDLRETHDALIGLRYLWLGEEKEDKRAINSQRPLYPVCGYRKGQRKGGPSTTGHRNEDLHDS